MTFKETFELVANASGSAKKITLGIVVISFIIGVLGSMGIVPLEMDTYTKFLDNYQPTLITLLCSIGVGSAVKTGAEVIAKKKEETK
jgi:hypothetical protein